jgi:hypothetical protein
MAKKCEAVINQARRCLTTGILNRNTNTNFAHIEIANFTGVTQNAIITVFTWGTTPASPIPGCTFNINVAANSRRTLNGITLSFSEISYLINPK